ncbi:sulfite exporter TauE/SafE family protein [Beijerinckia sp. L45]|uniref:sulfite exporter TauE/SafE family protein n=1 Tax=Beijerinckia sp. L45 TaxID=1641855 RepID=UPI00131C59DD|nr:sulfite exporter TauE/SafE family protein [Beijerinckia sp. L45]
MDWHQINWLYTASGFAVGVLVGLTGVGGGSLMTPLLVLLFGVAPATAVGTDLLYAAITKSGGVVVHGLHRTIDWRIVRRLTSGSVPATALTIFALSRMGVDGHGKHGLISTMLGLALVLTAIAIVFRKVMLVRLAPAVERLGERKKLWLTVLLGAFLGIFVSISSVGAGAIGVTVLLLLYPTLPTVRVVGADIAHAVPLTLIAGMGHWYLGSVNWAILVSLIIGSLPGIMLSSHVASKVPETVLRPLLAAILAIVGVRLVV